MNCKTHLLQQFIDGLLSDIDHKKIIEHIDSCEICNEKVEQLIEQKLHDLPTAKDCSLKNFRVMPILLAAINYKKNMRRNFSFCLKVAAIAVVIISASFIYSNSYSENNFSLSTKIQGKKTNLNYVISINNSVNNSPANYSTVILDTSTFMASAKDKNVLQESVTQLLSELKKGDQIDLIIAGVNDHNFKNITLANIGKSEVMNQIFNTRLARRLDYDELIDNGLKHAEQNFIDNGINNLIFISNAKIHRTELNYSDLMDYKLSSNFITP